MGYFKISNDIGLRFHQTIHLDLDLADIYIKSKKIHTGLTGVREFDILMLVNSIDSNSSLRIDFGWSFVDRDVYQQLMKDVLQQVRLPFAGYTVHMTADACYSWLGFVPINSLERTYLRTLEPSVLLDLHNSIIDYQSDVITGITGHPAFKQHAIIFDVLYRFRYFKSIRKDSAKLRSAFEFYIESARSVYKTQGVDRDTVDKEIGCHFLYNPDLYFELLAFSILKGDVYE